MQGESLWKLRIRCYIELFISLAFDHVWCAILFHWTIIKLVYLNGNNAAEGENNIKYANSYPMN